MYDLKQLHEMCAVCSSEVDNEYSLGVVFQLDGAQQVKGVFNVLPRHQGYSGLLHGGIASSLLDAAMTHCLLNMNVAALTAQLDVRYHHPILLGESVEVIGQCISVKRGIYFLKALLNVGGELRVSASGKFIRSAMTGVKSE